MVLSIVAAFGLSTIILGVEFPDAEQELGSKQAKIVIRIETSELQVEVFPVLD